LIPIRIIPVRRRDVSRRIGSVGRRIPCHCRSVLALIVSLFSAKALPVDS